MPPFEKCWKFERETCFFLLLLLKNRFFVLKRLRLSVTSLLLVMEVAKKIVSPSVADIFASMEYGPAPESDKIVQQWLEDHQRSFGHFINNQWIKPADRKFIDSQSPADGKFLAKTIQGTAKYTKNISMRICCAKKISHKI